MKIKIKNLIHKYNDFISLKDINLEVKEGELIALLGPSGCGKTTLLKTIAGLTDAYSGEILLGQNDITDAPPQKRETALVFQNYALFPHMTVAENIEYGLKVKKINKEERIKKINEVLEIVKLEGYQYRKIHELSGGQQQRVALARALVIEPKVLLFDEPLSNLDEKLRVIMREEIRRIQKKLGITSIYVTHDQEEAMAIADRIAVMESGKIHQVSPSSEVYSQPENEFVARFMGVVNIIPFEFKKVKESDLVLKVLNREISIPMNNKIDLNKIKQLDNFRLMIRPENIIISDKGISGSVKRIEHLGPIIRYTVIVDSKDFMIIEANVRERFLEEGENIKVEFNWDKAKLIHA